MRCLFIIVPLTHILSLERRGQKCDALSQKGERVTSFYSLLFLLSPLMGEEINCVAATLYSNGRGK
jgi:hypothetical protein